jgi:alkyl hydroperoxide reductase subunit F
MYDSIIVGAGPAGITASVYAARKKMNFLIITKDIGGQAAWSADIENYTGYQFITGPELTRKFKEHLDQFGVKLNEGETVNLIEKENNIIEIATDRSKYETKTALIASGRIPRKLNIRGENEFKNKGVTYCATCDGPLFGNMDVAVVGGGNSALDATLQLIKISKKIYLIDIADRLRADPVMTEKVKNNDKVTVYNKTKVKEIHGDNFVNGIRISRGGKPENLAVQGVFIETGSVPASEFVKNVEKNKMGDIIVNCKCETNIPGIFAAGDVTDVVAKQIIVACGEGAKAAISAFGYLNREGAKKNDK